MKRLYKTAIITGYYGLFRVGELTTGSDPILVENIYIGNNKWKIQIVLKSSKTHSETSAPQIVQLAGIEKFNLDLQNNFNYCPCKVVPEYIKVRKTSGGKTGPLFIFQDGRPVSPENLGLVLQRAIKTCGLDETVYGCHSLRSGRALDLMKIGFSVETIKLIGRWKSNAVYKYIRENN